MAVDTPVSSFRRQQVELTVAGVGVVFYFYTRQSILVPRNVWPPKSSLSLPWPWHSWKSCAWARYGCSCNVDMKYNHAYYFNLRDQEIQKCKRASMSKTTQNKPKKQSVKLAMFSLLFSIVAWHCNAVMTYVREVTMFRPICSRSNASAS